MTSRYWWTWISVKPRCLKSQCINMDMGQAETRTLTKKHFSQMWLPNYSHWCNMRERGDGPYHTHSMWSFLCDTRVSLANSKYNIVKFVVKIFRLCDVVVSLSIRAEVPGSIPVILYKCFWEYKFRNWVHPTSWKQLGSCLMRSSEIRLIKLKLS